MTLNLRNYVLKLDPLKTGPFKNGNLHQESYKT